MGTRETVNELLRRIAGGDHTKIAELYAEQISWKLAWPTDDYKSVFHISNHTASAASAAARCVSSIRVLVHGDSIRHGCDNGMSVFGYRVADRL